MAQVERNFQVRRETKGKKKKNKKHGTEHEEAELIKKSSQLLCTHMTQAISYINDENLFI